MKVLRNQVYSNVDLIELTDPLETLWYKLCLVYFYHAYGCHCIYIWHIYHFIQILLGLISKAPHFQYVDDLIAPQIEYRQGG